MKRLISLLIVAILLVAIFPVVAYAAEGQSEYNQESAVSACAYSDEEIALVSRVVLAEAQEKFLTSKAAAANAAAVFPVVALAYGDETEEAQEETASPRVYTDEEIEIVARVVYGEARGESLAGKVAVANAVKNRVESDIYSDDVEQVASAKNQFAYSGKTNDDCRFAAKLVLSYNISVLPTNAYYFQRSKAKDWRDFVYWGRTGDHSFYTKGEPVMPEPIVVPAEDSPEYLAYSILQAIAEDLRGQFKLG